MVSESAYVAPSAVLCGAVTLGERARVLHGAVLTAEDGEIWVGDDVVIMEHALVRGRSRHPVSIGNAVLIGPHAHLNGRQSRTKSSSRPERHCFRARLRAHDRSCGSTACCTSTLAWSPKRSFLSVGSRRVIQRSFLHRISMINYGRSNLNWTFQGPCTACRAAPRCVRSWPGRLSSTALTKTTRSYSLRGVVRPTAAD